MEETVFRFVMVETKRKYFHCSKDDIAEASIMGMRSSVDFLDHVCEGFSTLGRYVLEGRELGIETTMSLLIGVGPCPQESSACLVLHLLGIEAISELIELDCKLCCHEVILSCSDVFILPS